MLYIVNNIVKVYSKFSTCYISIIGIVQSVDKMSVNNRIKPTYNPNSDKEKVFELSE